MSKATINNILLPVFLIVIMAWFIAGIGYYTPREEFYFFIFQYTALFISFYVLWLRKGKLKFSHLFIAAVLLRFILLFSVPELSNDFYRFIWDGELLAGGTNPFAETPDQIFHNPGLFTDDYRRALYHGMQSLSQEHYTCYPVLNQFLFFIPAYFFDSISANVISLKLIVILADIGAIFYAKKIAEHLKINTHNVWLYGLNPFIILEFSGNLHFEGVMIFFLLLSIYLLLKNNWMWAAVFFGCAVQIKLIPLMLIPFVYKKLKWRKAIGFTALTGIVVLGIGGILLTEAYFQNMMQSVNEYFVRFQFNSSFYNLIVNYGYTELDYDRFKVVGKGLSYISTAGILLLATLRAYRNDLDIMKGMLFAFMIYYTCATTVHPWYISLVLIFSIFTQYKIGVIWSFLIMLSYAAYAGEGGFKEDPVMIIIEYVLIYTVLIYEIVKYWRKEAVGIQFKAFFSNKEE